MKKYKWEKICSSEAELHFQSNGMLEVEVGGKKLCVLKSKDQLYACSARCPHASGVMSEGFVDAVGNIVCPLHRYKFDPANGRNVSGEGYFLKTYPIEKREDGIYIGFEEGGLFGWLK